ncbi:hypothetical protein [Nonomuraea harbinensis]|uniref:Uncharacterized protein n=1 Tax=Nonomuraea harbinensis TaxID=1286938 RepID=A0ABW1C9L6_9ACTN|nr:hypothetical protein [Nonomuraea harbinensis]
MISVNGDVDAGGGLGFSDPAADLDQRAGIDPDDELVQEADRHPARRSGMNRANARLVLGPEAGHSCVSLAA